MNLNATFAWIGVVLVNIGFLALISWGGSTLWLLGFALSAIYTICLYFLAKWLQKREEQHHYEIIGETATMMPTIDGSNTDVEGDEIERAGTGQQDDVQVITASARSPTSLSTSPPKITLAVNLLYGLTVVSLAGTGLFLPLNLIENCDGSYQPNHHRGPMYTWTTNITVLPSTVQNWAMKDDVYNTIDPSFAYQVNTKTTIFRGTAERDFGRAMIANECLWTVDSVNPPRSHDDYLSPARFHAISNASVCFTSTTKKSGYAEMIYCTNGSASVVPAVGTGPLYKSGNIGNFFVDNGLLWFMQFYEKTGYGRLIYSLNPETMDILLHSYKLRDENHGDDRNKDCHDRTRLQAFAILLVSIFPGTLISILAWYLKQIPSMAVTTFGGMYASFLLSYVVVVGDTDGQSFISWHESWLCAMGSIWLVVLAYLSLDRSTTETQRVPMNWGLVVSGMAFFAGTSMLLHENMDDDTFAFWVVWNLVVFLPLLLLGMATDSMFLVLFGGIGFLVDSVRVGAFVGSKVSDAAHGPVGFLVFAVAGLVAGALGYKLTQYQPLVENGARKAQECVHRWIIRPRETDLVEVSTGQESLLEGSATPPDFMWHYDSELAND